MVHNTAAAVKTPLFVVTTIGFAESVALSGRFKVQWSDVILAR